VSVEGKHLLVVANAYPSDSAIYRNGFIHRRVKAYQAAGYSVTVYYLHPPAKTQSTYVYDGVEVVLGNELTYATFISMTNHHEYLIHFVSPAMIEPIRKYRSRVRLIIWIHGFEAEAWHRRWFNFIQSPNSIRAAVAKRRTYYETQIQFLQWLYTTDELDITFIQVSEWFQKNVVEPDAGIAIPRSRVIPNMIDTAVFDYVPKPAEQRFQILSIRPYASRKYANDQTIQAIQILSGKPYFKNLTFTIFGQGPLFDETVGMVSQHENVHVTRQFLSQEEIARQHKTHGVFVCPTRFDSQGVSMCEAMSSGLVPISSDVAAIPEFVTHGETGLLAKPESPEDIAFWIERLYYNPDLFGKISAAAQEYVRANLSTSVILNQELEVIEGR